MADDESFPAQKAKSKRWLPGKLRTQQSFALPAPASAAADLQIRQAEDEQSKHAVAVALATAAAAEAAAGCEKQSVRRGVRAAEAGVRAALPLLFPAVFASWRMLSPLERRSFYLSNIYCSREAKATLPSNFALPC